jgi:hypothetical protein
MNRFQLQYDNINLSFLGHVLILSQQCTWLHMQGPTVSPVYCKRDGQITPDYYAIVICVPKKALYKSVQQLRAVSQDLLFSNFQCYGS